MADAVRYDPATKQSFPRMDIAHFEEALELALGVVPTANLATLAGAVAAARMQVDVDATTQGKLDTLHTDLATTLAAFLSTLAGAIASGRMKVDLATTPTANLATLAGAIASGRMAVDLATTPTANLATLAGAVASARMAVDLASTPTANLATLAGAISSAKMQADIAKIALPADFFYGLVTIGTSEVRLNAGSVACRSMVILKAHPSNTGILYIGKTGVLTSTGYPLAKGESVPWPAAEVNVLYGIADAASQLLGFVGGKD